MRSIITLFLLGLLFSGCLSLRQYDQPVARSQVEVLKKDFKYFVDETIYKGMSILVLSGIMKDHDFAQHRHRNENRSLGFEERYTFYKHAWGQPEAYGSWMSITVEVTDNTVVSFDSGIVRGSEIMLLK